MRLTRRERLVWPFLVEFRSNKEIAGALGITERTAKFHVSNILHKYGVQYRADLFRRIRHAQGVDEEVRDCCGSDCTAL